LRIAERLADCGSRIADYGFAVADGRFIEQSISILSRLETLEVDHDLMSGSQRRCGSFWSNLITTRTAADVVAFAADA